MKSEAIALPLNFFSIMCLAVWKAKFVHISMIFLLGFGVLSWYGSGVFLNVRSAPKLLKKAKKMKKEHHTTFSNLTSVSYYVWGYWERVFCYVNILYKSWKVPRETLWEVFFSKANYTVQKNKFSIKDFFNKCDQMVIFTEEILNGKLDFLCSVNDLVKHLLWEVFGNIVKG